jgi:hypothetical protein
LREPLKEGTSQTSNPLPYESFFRSQRPQELPAEFKRDPEKAVSLAMLPYEESSKPQRGAVVS